MKQGLNGRNTTKCSVRLLDLFPLGVMVAQDALDVLVHVQIVEREPLVNAIYTKNLFGYDNFELLTDIYGQIHDYASCEGSHLKLTTSS